MASKRIQKSQSVAEGKLFLGEHPKKRDVLSTVLGFKKIKIARLKFLERDSPALLKHLVEKMSSTIPRFVLGGVYNGKSWNRVEIDTCLDFLLRYYVAFPNLICLGPDSGRSIPLSPVGTAVIFPPAARNNWVSSIIFCRG